MGVRAFDPDQQQVLRQRLHDGVGGIVGFDHLADRAGGVADEVIVAIQILRPINEPGGVEHSGHLGLTMLRLPEHEWRHREGFALTDPGMNTQQALDQVNYCIWCHNQGKDSCSRGLKDRKTGARETLTIEAAINKLTA